MSIGSCFQLAQRECAEWVALDGGCIKREDRRCVLASQEPCRYLRDAVLPLVDKYARYGRVKAAWATLQAKWQAKQGKESAEALTWAGRAPGPAPCGKCLNCLNGHRQLCLCRKDAVVAQPQTEARVTPGIVSSYCLCCKAPIYTRHARHCSEKCRKASERAASLARRERVRQRHQVPCSKPLDSIEPKEAL